MRYVLFMASMMLALWASCSSGKAERGEATADSGLPSSEESVADATGTVFNADSAYAYVERLMAFGPRVPNTEAHRLSGDWLVDRLTDFGWQVTEQKTVINAFDGTPLNVRNIFAQINPDKPNRLLLLAHWDCRPWADEDPDPQKRSLPVAGANDGASGVGVLLEIARQLSESDSDAAVDILLVDAEDWGETGDDDSWALGTQYFTANPPVKGYQPAGAILLDMVGSPDARFGFEYFSTRSNPALLQKVWKAASRLGHDKYFHTGYGGAVTDDHVELIKAGIPSIDIIDYRYSDGYQGFDPVWHTTADTMDNISPLTLKAVGETVLYVVTHN